MSRSARDCHNRQAGAALVEFAIIVPLLLLLLLGIVEFSYAFFHLNILNKSVQDGALYFSEWARCANANNCSPNIPINAGPSSTSCTGTNSANVSNARNLVMTGNTAACDDTTNPPLLPLCANYTGGCPIQFDANHIQVTASYQHNFITGTALSSIASIMFGTSSFANSYNLTASSVMRAQ
jgi:Flp pilus assembly protein TadG